MTVASAVLFPDAVAVCTTYLAAALDAGGDSETHVDSRITQNARQVVLELVDAQRHRDPNVPIQTSTIRVDCWVDETLGQEGAQDLGQLCRGLLGAMQGTRQAGATVYKVGDAEITGLNDAPDPISGKERYSFHYTISMRGGATVDYSVDVTIPEWFTRLQGAPGPSGPTGPEGPTGLSIVDSEPDDADIATGACVLWYEATAGAPLLHVKSKDTLGAVFGATVPLTA